jgi:poly(3-hydroxyalkanoate) synthetase
MMPLQRLALVPTAALTRHGQAFFEEAVLRAPPPPRWTTPNRVVLESGVVRVREFTRARSPGEAVARVPVLVVPPEVNQSFIVDFAPDQSLVARLLDGGFEKVLAVEWLPPTAETARRDIDASIEAILQAIDRAGGRVHLIGVCQGGWESAVATALAPEAVRTLTLVAAPVDFHAGEGMIKHVARSTPMAFYRALVALGGGVMPGEYISGGFDGLMSFERYWLKYLALWNHLAEPQWLHRYRQLNDWYRAPKDLAGPMYLRVVRELFKQNRLVRGRFRCLGQTVDLGRVRCPLCLIAGQRDHITPPRQVWATRRAVASTDVLRVETSGGHVGAFMGRTELRETWPQVLSWLRERDG